MEERRTQALFEQGGAKKDEIGHYLGGSHQTVADRRTESSPVPVATTAVLSLRAPSSLQGSS